MSEFNDITSFAVRTREIKPGYAISEDGRVWSAIVPGHKPRIGTVWKELGPSPQKSGHMRVWFGRNDMRYVHVIVLEAFVGPCPSGLECRHLDGNPANNNLWNLCWGTRKENGEDRIRHGRSGKGEAGGMHVLTEDDVREVLRMRAEGKTMIDIARWFGVHDRTIQAIMYGRSWTHITGFAPYAPKSNNPGRPKVEREPVPTSGTKRPRGGPTEDVSVLPDREGISPEATSYNNAETSGSVWTQGVFW